VKIVSKRLCRVFSVFADFSQRKMLRLYDAGQVFHDLQSNTKLGCGIHIQAFRFLEVCKQVIRAI